MTQDFRPEDIATVQRALVSVDFVLLLAACLLSLFALRRLAPFAAALRARIPLRARTLALSFALALALFGGERAVLSLAYGRAVPDADRRDPDAAVCAAPAARGVRRAARSGARFAPAGARAPIWLRLAAELLLVPCAYAIGLAIIYLSLSLIELESWNGFQRAAFYSAAVFALPVALIPGFYRARGLCAGDGRAAC